MARKYRHYQHIRVVMLSYHSIVYDPRENAGNFR